MMMALGFFFTILVGDLLISIVSTGQIYGSRNYSAWKWQLLENSESSPDIVILGSSYEAYGVKPSTIKQSLEAGLRDPVGILNLSSSASSLLTQNIFVRRMLDEGYRPDVVYLGVTPNAVDTWMRSWLQNGLTALGGLHALPMVCVHDPSLLQYALPAALFRSYHRWHETSLLTRRLILGAPLNPPSDEHRYADGWAEWRGKTHSEVVTAETGNGGIAGGDDRMALRMSPANINGVALRDSISALRRAGVAVRLLELPHASYAPAYASPGRNRYYRRFVEVISREMAVDVLRPPAGLLDDDDYWDGVHLAATGAESVSRWLARDADAVVRASRSDHRLADNPELQP